MEKIETPVNRLRRILHESGTISDIDWQEAIEAEQIEMMTAVDLFVYHKKFTEDAFKTWYLEHYQEKYAAESQPPVMLSLPDDEEIEKKAQEWLKANYGKYKPSEWRAFIESAIWMREFSKCNGALCFACLRSF